MTKSTRNESDIGNVIYCAGSLGRTIANSINRGSNELSLAFVDDDESLYGQTIAGFPILGGVESFDGEIDVIIGYGADTETRKDIVENARETDAGFFSVVDPAASVSDSCRIEDGVYVNAQSYLGPDVQLQDHVVIDSSVNVSHDTVVEQNSILTPGATIAGNVHIDQGVYVGPGATILKGRKVGTGAIIGAGAVVTEDVESGETVVGVPASPI